MKRARKWCKSAGYAEGAVDAWGRLGVRLPVAPRGTLQGLVLVACRYCVAKRHFKDFVYNFIFMYHLMCQLLNPDCVTFEKLET